MTNVPTAQRRSPGYKDRVRLVYDPRVWDDPDIPHAITGTVIESMRMGFDLRVRWDDGRRRGRFDGWVSWTSIELIPQSTKAVGSMAHIRESLQELVIGLRVGPDESEEEVKSEVELDIGDARRAD